MNTPQLLKTILLSSAVVLILAVSVCSAQTIQTTGDVNQHYPGTGSPWVIDGSAPNGADGFRIGDVIGANGGVGSLLISDGATVLNNNSSGAGGIAGLAILGFDSGTSGTATITGPGSQWINEFSLSVGAFGSGTLEIFNGGMVSNTAGGIGLNPDVSGFPSPMGLATVNGAGSQWNVAGELNVGFFNGGTLNIEAGGIVNNQNSYVGHASSGGSGGVGVVNVSGPSQWNSSGNVGIGGDPFGQGTSGELNISGGALVKVSDPDPGDMDATGILKIHAPGQVNLSGGTLDVGTLDLADATSGGFNMTGGRLVADTVIGNLTQLGGTLAPGNSPGLTDIQGNYELANAGILEFEFAASMDRGIDYDAIDVSGFATLNGTIDVNLIDGFEAEANDNFFLVNAGTGSGSISGMPTFDFSDADLAPGLAWNTSTFLTNGAISVSAVPEPGSIALIAGLIGFAGMRRRKRAQAT